MTRILVVDDDALILQALTKILQNEGHEVIAHTDPHKASKELEFSVVITDFMMPNLNGIELRRPNYERGVHRPSSYFGPGCFVRTLNNQSPQVMNSVWRSSPPKVQFVSVSVGVARYANNVPFGETT